MTFVLVKLICRPLLCQSACLVAQTVKKLPVMQETRVRLLSQKDSLEKEIAAHFIPWWLRAKVSACNAGDPGSILGLERSPGEGNGHPLQYSCLENPMSEEPDRL